MAHDAYIFRYRVRNWRTYNQALIARGGLTFWIDEAALTTLAKHPGSQWGIVNLTKIPP